MTAKYDFKTSPDIQGDKEQASLYPQLVVSGTKDLTDLAKEIARRSTIKEGTVMGLFCDLENIIANYLADGYNVKLGELGTLSATLTCRKVAAKGELERAEYGFRDSSSQYSEEERFALLTVYLKEHSVINCKEYCKLTGLLKTKAGMELRRWDNEKKIVREGRTPHVIYRAVPEA